MIIFMSIPYSLVGSSIYFFIKQTRTQRFVFPTNSTETSFMKDNKKEITRRYRNPLLLSRIGFVVLHFSRKTKYHQVFLHFLLQPPPDSDYSNSMMLPLRLCYLKTPCILNEECNIPGGGELREENRELAYRVLSGFNLSIIAKNTQADSGFDEEKSDECLHSLQRNESDVIFTSYSMPVLLKNITTGPVAWETKVGFVSTYEFEDHNNRPGILRTFHSFSLEVCCLIFLCLLTMFILVIIASVLKKRRVARKKRVDRAAGLIFSYFVKQFHSWPGRMSCSKRILNCCLLMFSFSVTFSYISMIKTEMVTVKTPQIIASYQDILDDPDVELFMDHILDEHRLFRTASRGSLRNKIWNRMIRLGLDKHLVNTPDNAMEIQNKLMNRKAVIIVYGHFLNAGRYMGTLVAKKTTKRFLVSFDPSEQPVMASYLTNSFMPKEIFVKWSKKIRRYVESGLGQQFFDTIAKIGAKVLKRFMELDSDISDDESYFSERVLLPHPVVINPDLQYFSSFFILFLVLCVFEFVVLIIEMILHKKNAQQK